MFQLFSLSFLLKEINLTVDLWWWILKCVDAQLPYLQSTVNSSCFFIKQIPHRVFYRIDPTPNSWEKQLHDCLSYTIGIFQKSIAPPWCFLGASFLKRSFPRSARTPHEAMWWRLRLEQCWTDAENIRKQMIFRSFRLFEVQQKKCDIPISYPIGKMKGQRTSDVQVKAFFESILGFEIEGVGCRVDLPFFGMVKNVRSWDTNLDLLLHKI